MLGYICASAEFILIKLPNYKNGDAKCMAEKTEREKGNRGQNNKKREVGWAAGLSFSPHQAHT